jgi:hypothetical protein
LFSLEHKRRSEIGLTQEEVAEQAHLMARFDALNCGTEGEARDRLADLEKLAERARRDQKHLKPRVEKNLRLLELLYGKPPTSAMGPKLADIHPFRDDKPANDGNLYPYNSELRPPPILIDEDGAAIADELKIVYDDPNCWPYTAFDRYHLIYVAREPCLVCGARSAHAHHLRFTEELARKVSDEYTVPLCGDHFAAVKDTKDEAKWWEATTADPIAVARALWRKTHPEVTAAQVRDPAEGHLMRSRRLAFYGDLYAEQAASMARQPPSDVASAAPVAR